MKSMSISMGICLLLILCGCSPKRKNLEACLHEVKWCACLEQLPKSNEMLSITIAKEMNLPPTKDGKNPYPLLVCQAQLNNLEGGREYMLYGPNTGNPEQPEFLCVFRYDEQGVLWKADDHGAFSLQIESIQSLIPAIPGFSSDWFLLGTHELKQSHATLAYQPIAASSADGRTIGIEKKESGGNLLKVSLSGFQPHEKITLFSNSEGEKMTFKGESDDQGRYVSYVYPQVIDKTKGVITISFIASGKVVRASCDWNMQTLRVKRKQASIFRKG